MTEYLTAAEIKQLLVAGLKLHLRTVRMAFYEAVRDEGDPAGRPSTRHAIRESVRLLREVQDLPEDDPRIVRLTELRPTVDALIAVIPEDGRPGTPTCISTQSSTAP
ncbi:MAG TPA: hypothetical protein VME44_06890 [Streptosporangiaceae bacterium]|nr:hypothetical protein [Streptosporangiaceae bacterium]